jgi:hypothetical protein
MLTGTLHVYLTWVKKTITVSSTFILPNFGLYLHSALPLYFLFYSGLYFFHISFIPFSFLYPNVTFSVSYFFLTDAVSIGTGYGLDGGGVGVRVPVASRIFTTSSRPALGPPSLLWNRHRGLFPRE